MTNSKLNIQVVVSQPFAENAFIAYLEGRNDCLVFDPGFESDRIIAAIEEIGRDPAAIINTHGHCDHIAGNAPLKQRWPTAPLVIGSGDAAKLTDPRENLSAEFPPGIPQIISPAADQLVDEGDLFEAAGLELEVLHTPGHSRGHVVFVWKKSSPWVVFGGDVLFRGSYGRTDFPDGSFEELAESIHKKLFVMPDDTVVLTGHGEPTEIGFEKNITRLFNPQRKPILLVAMPFDKSWEVVQLLRFD